MNSLITAIPADNRQEWQQLLSQSIEQPAELLRHLELPTELLPAAEAAARLFPLRVPLPFLQRIQPGDPRDPLLLQILPLQQEMLPASGFSKDPLGEQSANPVPGLIHKYQGRVLLIVTGACAINCRYCFRRHFPYQDNRLGPDQWQQILDYIRADDSIREVIFSGGDPLATPDQRLARLIAELEQIPHLQRLRIHSRLPIMIPQRVTDELCGILTRSRLKPVLVIHANHANELDDSVASALNQLRQAGVTLLNQTVLLRGINDQVEVLQQLSERLFAIGVLPYYLFTLDKVDGASHFDLDDTEAQQLFAELQTLLPGYLVPRLAKEIAGRPSKTLLPPLG